MTARHLLTDTVTIAPDQGIDRSTGAQQYGAQTDYACRIEYDGARQYDASGELTDTLDAIVIQAALDKDILVWLPGADTSSADEAISPDTVRRASTPDGSMTLTRLEL